MGFFNKAILNAGKAVAPKPGALTGAIKPVAQAAPSGGSGPFAQAVQAAQAAAAKAKAAPTPAPAAKPAMPVGKAPSNANFGDIARSISQTAMPLLRGMRFKEGGKASSSKSSGKVSTASKRGDGIAQRGKTKGRML
jgi:hypothetical protein